MLVTGIYRIRNTITGECYIGSSLDVDKRFGQHRRALAKQAHFNRLLQGAWSSCGSAAFIFEVVTECAPGRLLAEEQVAIDREQPAYNIIRVIRWRFSNGGRYEIRRQNIAAVSRLKALADQHAAKTPQQRQREPVNMAAIAAFLLPAGDKALLAGIKRAAKRKHRESL